MDKREERVVRMEETLLTQEVLDAVKTAAADNSLRCPEARKVAEKLDVPYTVIGKACNQLGIKIKGCSLGCF